MARLAPDGMIVHIEDDVLSALDSGDLALCPVTLQWQRESEALQRGREAEQALAQRKEKKEALKRRHQKRQEG